LIDKLPENSGSVLTFDALHTVKDTFRQVVGKGADFFVCVKNNASDLRSKLDKHLIRNKKNLQSAETVDHGHGRIEHRSIEMTSILPWQTGWPHTHMVCRITRKRALVRKKQIVSESLEEIICVGSFSINNYSPLDVLALDRGHWTIENSLHHRKDRSMDEDRNRASVKKSGRTMCYLRSFTAMIFNRSKESLSVIQRRISSKIHLVLNLFDCNNISEWEQKHCPYKLA